MLLYLLLICSYRRVAPKSAEEGADTPAWVALAQPKSANGVFFSDRKDVGY